MREIGAVEAQTESMSRVAVAHHTETDGPALTVRCAWCGTVLLRGGPRVSHGICNTCRRDLEREIDDLATATHAH